MPLRSLVLAVLLVLSAPAAAQAAIETRMTPEEFKAAGLDKLTAEELARLNAWLGRTGAQASTGTAPGNHATHASMPAPAAAAREPVPGPPVKGASRSGEPIESRIVGPFEGFADRREYTLENGQVWRQVDGAKLPGVRLDSPAVRLNASMLGNVWYLKVDGYNTRAKVVRVR